MAETEAPMQYEYRRDRAASGTSARYRYTARDMQGKLLRGTADAASYEALYVHLRSQGLFLEKATRLEGERRKVLRPKELATFCQELASLLKAGVNLIRALTILAQEEDLPPRLAIVYNNILAEVRKGVSLSVAMETQQIFPELMLGMIRAGEGNGDLDGVTARLAEHYTREHRLRTQVRSAMTYPIILAAVALIAVVIIFTFVLPEFDDLFAGMEDLPAFTVALMAISGFLVQRWYLALGGAVLLVMLIRVLLQVPPVGLALDRWKLKTRFLGLGKLNSVICTARFARTVSSLYTSGISLVDSLQTARKTIGNRYLARQFDAVVTKMCNGDTLASSLRIVDGLQKRLCSTIQVGEETGHLDTMLDAVAGTMEYDSEQASKRMVMVLEPLLIVFMALMVGVIMIGVMAPIIQSYGAIGSASY